MTTSPRPVIFKFGDCQQYIDNGLGFSIEPAPQYEILRITAHNPETKKSYTYESLEALESFCPTRFTIEHNKLYIAAQKIQRIHIWKENEGMRKSALTYDSKGFVGFSIPEGECTLELVHYQTAGTVRIHLILSHGNRSTPKIISPLESGSKTTSQSTTVNSNTTITGLQEQLNPTAKKKSNPRTIRQPYQEDTTSSVQQEPLEHQPTAGSAPTSSNADISSEHLQQIEAIVDSLLSRLEAVDKVVDTLIEQQTAHNEKQTKLAENIESIIPNLQSMLSQQ